MLGKDIKALVNVDPELDLGSQVASNTSDNTKDDSSPGGNETGSRSDGNKSLRIPKSAPKKSHVREKQKQKEDCNTYSNGSTAESDGTPLALKTVVHQAPGDATNTSCEVGHDASHDSAQVRSKSTTTIETEPANPKEDSAENDVRHIVWPVWQAVDLVVTNTLSEHKRVCESGSTGADVHGRTTSKVETTHLEGPAVGIPRPVGDRVVDDGRPDKDKDDGGQHASTVGNGTNRQGGRNGSKHALIQAKQQVGDFGAAYTWLRQHVHEAKVGEVADEARARVAKGEGVAPEEPLETDDAYAHHREPY